MEREAMIPYEGRAFSEEEMKQRSQTFLAFMQQRRSLREFSDRPVPKDVIHDIIMAASTAPSGAHKQPWTFCAISNAELKGKIREAAEKEEYLNYHGRMSDTWIEDLEPIGTDWNKAFLEVAPWLIAVFKRPFEMVDGTQRRNYYVNESVGLACGILLTAIHNAGLVALTHTPSPMNFLEKILQRPANERAFLLIPVGYPAEDAEVPNLQRKAEGEVLVFHT